MILHDKTWDTLQLFFSATYTQTHLKKCYNKLDILDKDTKSYENCYPFIYFLDHGQTYYKQAEISPLSIQPVLLFYGMIQLIKACLLTIDPNYPESTNVLAHGVTARKRKKQQYSFLQDEIKIQKNGLFPHMADKMFHLKPLDSEKFSMETLLQQIPDMNETVQFFTGSKNFESIKKTGNGFIVSASILDRFQMTQNRFKDYLESKSNVEVTIVDSLLLNITPSTPSLFKSSSPLRYHLGTEEFMLSLNKESMCFSFPELLIHYLILYNLSMISRYETEWWSELIKTTPTNDYPFINQFLKSTQEKVPFLLSNWLFS